MLVRVIVVAVFALGTTFCAPRSAPRASADAPPDLAALWVDPVDLESRDLFYGPGGRQLAPDHETRFDLVKIDRSGYSAGYDVRDPQGRTWSVKIGPEAQTEVAVSRILWAMGYHQPPTYLLVDWRANDAAVETAGGARFRPDLETSTATADWSWYENPFVGTKPFQGLVAANILLNNWDWKTSNNKVYEVLDGSPGPRQRYVVRDLGASLGKTSFPKMLRWTPMRGFGQGSRNDLEGFEAQAFIRSVEGERVKFDYRGIHPKVVDSVSVADVVWACTLLDRISDEQFVNAFRAAGYTPEYQRRYAAKIRAKIREGLALRQS